MSDINWNQELRKIEREYDGLPPLRTRTQIRMQKVQEVLSKGRFEKRLAIFGIWTRLILIGAAGTALYWWPYGNACGVPLLAFLASYVMVIIGGVAVAARTWRDRLVWPFVCSALFIVAAWTVVALHTLPRLSYPTVGSVRAAWVCADRSR